MTPSPIVTRFAPSPTGELHLGNLRTALVAWLAARSVGKRFLVRMEDLDRVTSSIDHERRQLADLAHDAGALVYIDGAPTSYRTPAIDVPLPCGPHEVSVSIDGTLAPVQTIEVRAGEIATARFTSDP